jgi:hypothetical protein
VIHSSHKNEISGPGIEWRPNSPATSVAPYQAFDAVDDSADRPSSGSNNIEALRISTSKMQQLSVHDDLPVIIPDHLQVPEAERTHLNFGSFGDDFDDNRNYADEDDDDKKSASSVEETLPDEAPLDKINADRLANAL